MAEASHNINNSNNQKTRYWQLENKHLIVVPSISVDQHELSCIRGASHYEERCLYSLFALCSPNTYITLVTTMPLDQSILKYYLSMVPTKADDRKNLEDRIQCISVCDGSNDSCLTQKILSRPRLLNRLRVTIEKYNNSKYNINNDDDNNVLMVWIGTEYESRLANELGLKLYAATGPEQTKWGTKAGSRELFHILNIPCIDGTYTAAYSQERLIDDIISVLKRNPYAKRGVVKLMEGFSGQGNAEIDCTEIQQVLHNNNSIYIKSNNHNSNNNNNGDDNDNQYQINDDNDYSTKKEEKKDDNYVKSKVVPFNETIIRNTVLKALINMEFCNTKRTWYEDFEEEVRKMGAIFELYIESPSSSKINITSPSVQVVVNEDLTVTVLSTHEQILHGQVYAGCQFPCYSSYRTKLMEYGYQVGTFLAKQNIVDHFAVDFMCIPPNKNDDDDWDIYAVEINLRLTGTTHPWMTMKLLTHGYTDTKTGLFVLNSNNDTRSSNQQNNNLTSCNRFYVASDTITDPALRRLLPIDVLDLVTTRKDLKWDPLTQTGVIFHMLSCLSENGKIGMTAIENSRDKAQELFDNVVGCLREEAYKTVFC